MFGTTVTETVERILKERGISKGKFYSESGITSATFSNWKRGVFEPSSEQIKKIENYLGISFEIKEKTATTFASADEIAANIDDSIRFALFGTTDISDELYEEVKRYAKYALEQEKFKKFHQQKG